MSAWAYPPAAVILALISLALSNWPTSTYGRLLPSRSQLAPPTGTIVVSPELLSWAAVGYELDAKNRDMPLLSFSQLKDSMQATSRVALRAGVRTTTSSEVLVESALPPPPPGAEALPAGSEAQ